MQSMQHMHHTYHVYPTCMLLIALSEYTVMLVMLKLSMRSGPLNDVAPLDEPNGPNVKLVVGGGRGGGDDS